MSGIALTFAAKVTGLGDSLFTLGVLLIIAGVGLQVLYLILRQTLIKESPTSRDRGREVDGDNVKQVLGEGYT